MSKASVAAELKRDWHDILAAARAMGFNKRVTLPANPRILGSSVKVEHGESLKVLTAIAYLSPALESGIDTCAYRNGCGCERSCIGTSTGMLVFEASRNARLYKTALYYGRPQLFHRLLQCEIEALARKAERLGMVPAVRLNGSSDIGVEWPIARRNPTVKFYDYTKSHARAFLSLSCASYHVTLSHTGSNTDDCVTYLSRGGNVAVVFPTRKGEPFPATWNGYPVIDGDSHDVRFYDPPGTVVGLSFKRASKRGEMLEQAQKTGFVQLRVKHAQA